MFYMAATECNTAVCEAQEVKSAVESSVVENYLQHGEGSNGHLYALRAIERLI